jgi:hypothetical protein
MCKVVLMAEDIAGAGRMISEYEIGWVLTLAFLSLSFSYLNLFIAIRSEVLTITGRTGLVFLFLGVVGRGAGYDYPRTLVSQPVYGRCCVSVIKHFFGAVRFISLARMARFSSRWITSDLPVSRT